MRMLCIWYFMGLSETSMNPDTFQLRTRKFDKTEIDLQEIQKYLDTCGRGLNIVLVTLG